MASRTAQARLRKLLGSAAARRAGAIAGKATVGAVAAGAGLALGLREAKKALRAEEALDLWRDVTFNVSPGAKRLGAGGGDQEDPGAVLSRLAAKGGFTFADFQAAARRLRPVELQLEELIEASAAESSTATAARNKRGAQSVSGSEAEDALLERWRAAGYLTSAISQRTRAELFGRRLTGDAQGVDIGVLVPPYLVPSSLPPSRGSGAAAAATPSSDEAMPAVRPARWQGGAAERRRAVEVLQRWGCAVLQGAVAPEDVAELRQSLGLGSAFGHVRRAGELGQFLQQRDANVSMGRYTYGRLHCLLRGSPEFEPDAVAAHAAVAPLVHAFFEEDEARGERVFLSEAQLILAEPCAEAQFWHIDSVGGRSLSAFIPLSDISSNKGPQAVLPGSHCLHDASLSLRQRLRGCFGALCTVHGETSMASTPDRQWSAGDVLLLDGRTLHRGLANDSLGAPAAVLVLRYDLASSPPPGCSRRWLLLMTQVGNALQGVFKLYAAV